MVLDGWYFVIIHPILKALPPVCMKYTARSESQMANIAQGKAECYICHEMPRDPHQELYTFIQYKQSGSALSVLLYFKLKDVLTEDFFES